MEISIRPLVAFCGASERRNDVGHAVFQKWRQTLGDAVIQQQNNDATLDHLFVKMTHHDYFYQDGSVRQRVAEDTNVLPEWRRKQALGTTTPLDWTWPTKSLLSCKTQVKREAPLHVPLPREVSPIFSRRKTTYRYRFAEHPCCWIDLSEIQNIKYHGSHGALRSTEDGPLLYELEVELSPQILSMAGGTASHAKKNDQLSLSTVQHEDDADKCCRLELWNACGNIVSHVYQIMGLNTI